MAKNNYLKEFDLNVLEQITELNKKKHQELLGILQEKGLPLDIGYYISTFSCPKVTLCIKTKKKSEYINFECLYPSNIPQGVDAYRWAIALLLTAYNPRLLYLFELVHLLYLEQHLLIIS